MVDIKTSAAAVFFFSGHVLPMSEFPNVSLAFQCVFFIIINLHITNVEIYFLFLSLISRRLIVGDQ